MKTSLLILILSSIIGLAGCSPYASSVHVKTGQHSSAAKVNLYFSSSDRALIREYYLRHGRYKKVPPGHYKRRGVPFKRHKPLPRNVYYYTLPRELDRRLGVLPANYIRIRVGDEFAIMDTRTRVIYDMIWLFE